MLRQKKGKRKEKSVYIFKLSLPPYISYYGVNFLFSLLSLGFSFGLQNARLLRIKKSLRTKRRNSLFFFRQEKLSFFLSFVCTYSPCVPYIKKAHECFSITFHVSFLVLTPPISTRRICRMDRRVIERTYIYVFMTRAPTRPDFNAEESLFLPLKLNFHSSFVSTAMCAFFHSQKK